MMIAAALDMNSMDAVIPETLDSSAGILIFGIEEDAGVEPWFVTKDIAQAMEAAGCEALLCGAIYDPNLFEPIADAGITRYMAAGMTVRQAIPAMMKYKLDMITDYVGGSGCSGHGHDHHHVHEECDGNCQECALAGADCEGM